jgi:hypothetical protein
MLARAHLERSEGVLHRVMPLYKLTLHVNVQEVPRQKSQGEPPLTPGVAILEQGAGWHTRMSPYPLLPIVSTALSAYGK